MAASPVCLPMAGELPSPKSLLALGGARSGKSAFAQARAEASGLDRVFIATAHAYDDEMTDRIARHRADRDMAWQTIEAPYALADTMLRQAAPDRILLVDCLTLWLTNIMLREDDVEAASHELAAVVRTLQGPCILVSNEVGWGIVPENALARRFRDAQGRLNQRLAAACESVVLIAAGLPLVLKPQASNGGQA